jgi:hypothetical protein
MEASYNLNSFIKIKEIEEEQDIDDEFIDVDDEF